MQRISKEVYEFISKQANQPIVEWRTCKASGELFPIYQGEVELLEKMTPTIGGKKMPYDLPKYCYWVRMIRREIFRNERKFYAASCATTGKKEISLVHDCVRDIIPPKERHETDFSQWGIAYSGDFYADVKKLYESVPYLPRYVVNSENSEYCNQAYDEKNCYLCVGGQNSENCLYSTHDVESKYIIDSYGALRCEIVYESSYVWTSMKAFFCTYLLNCYNTRFSYDLQNCKNILFGFGLRDQEYVFKNKKYSKKEREKIFEEYAKKIRTIDWLSEMIREYDEFISTNPHEATHNVNVENSRGAQINNSKNMFFWFGTEGQNDSRYCSVQGRSQYGMDLETSSMSQLAYNCIGSTQLYGCACMASNLAEMRDSYYGLYVRGWNNILWCFGIHNQSYYILNKKYEKDEWEKLAITITEELTAKHKRGEFLDTERSPFAYNDTLANMAFPIQQLKIWWELQILDPDGFGTVEVLHPEQFISDAWLDLGGEEKWKIKWRTKETEINLPTNVDAIPAENLPNAIDDVSKDICGKIILCKKTGRPFQILPIELEFYKQYGLPIPTLHHEIREQQRFKKQPRKFLDLSTCDNCGKEILNEHRKSHSYKIYCGDCYNKAIYW